MSQILIIDDDKKLNELLKDYLGQFGYEVHFALRPEEGLSFIQSQQPRLVILDVMLPGMDGFEVLKHIRKNNNLPVIMLTARGDLTDRVVGLELGADDYLPKPFEPRELAARIQTILRRTEKTTLVNTLDFGNLKIYLDRHEVFLNEKPVSLTSTEFELFVLFVENPGRVLSRDEIMEKVRGIEWESFNRSVDVLVSRLRQKLGDDPKKPSWFKTVWGSGYIFLGKLR